uniref:Uncharacterized protein n=1 Tax=Tanacetum cinerariifolium TaxID=118510 RepID=A0A6L2KCJ4_TANCI|nr:hypothetical protein [Tanacetum cinerariifolium]
MGRLQDDAKRLCLVDDLKKLKDHIHVKTKELALSKVKNNYIKEEVEYFAHRMFFNLDKLEKQLNNEELDKEVSMVVFKCSRISFSSTLLSRYLWIMMIYWLLWKEDCIKKRMIARTKLEKKDECSRLGNDTQAEGKVDSFPSSIAESNISELENESRENIYEIVKCELQTKIIELEKVLTQKTKDFDDVKLELSNIMAKFEAYFKKL